MRRDVDPGQIPDPAIWRKLLGNVHWALIWLPFASSLDANGWRLASTRSRDSAWMDGGTALQGYWERAVAIPEQGRPSITYGWYRDFLQYMLDNEWYSWFGPLIAIGEVLDWCGAHTRCSWSASRPSSAPS